MRIASYSTSWDRTAFEAVLADLRQTSPDLILHGGDLADAGASPVEIVDRVRDLGWKGVVATQMKCFSGPSRSRSLRANRRRPLALDGDPSDGGGDPCHVRRRGVAWLRGLGANSIQDAMALVHGSPEVRGALRHQKRPMLNWNRFTGR